MSYHHLIRLPIGELNSNLYVANVHENNIAFLNSHGFISNRAIFKAINQSSARYVWIDPAKSKIPHLNFMEREIETPAAIELIDEAKTLLTNIIYRLHVDRMDKIMEITLILERVLKAFKSSQDSAFIVASLKAKEDYLFEHSVNVSIFLLTFGCYLGLDNKTLIALSIGGLLHDVGKVYIPKKILSKPERLTDDEFTIVKTHPEHGLQKLSYLLKLPPISLQVIAEHHEKLDGSGYPHGLVGEQISLYGRMAAICDIFDALTAERCYKEKIEQLAAIKILIGMAPKQLDQQLLNEFICCFGLYSQGTTVELSNKRLAVVSKENPFYPREPVVTSFYCLVSERYLTQEEIDLHQSELMITKVHTKSRLSVALPEELKMVI